MKMELSGWIEDSVVFKGVIRRSGNSLAITIPAELIQRFQLKEGQEFVMLGMSRSNPEFEGAIQVYFGYFVVYEKVNGLELHIKLKDNVSETLKFLSNLATRYGATKIVKRILDNDSIEFKMFFGMITDSGLRRPKSIDEIESMKAEILAELYEAGILVLSHKVIEEIVEWRNIDPSSISKLPHKAGEMIRWKWEL